jgi:hypothetical protein
MATAVDELGERMADGYGRLHPCQRDVNQRPQPTATCKPRKPLQSGMYALIAVDGPTGGFFDRNGAEPW